jgi:hypothetical protein
MKLIEILTKANNNKCECAGCMGSTYIEMVELTAGLENEIISVLADNKLSDIVNNGNGAANIHIKIRFSFLLNSVKKAERRKLFLKNIILNPRFDLDLLVMSLLVKNSGYYDSIMENSLNEDEAKQLGFVYMIENAYVFQRFPELFENKIQTQYPEKVLNYTLGILDLGLKHFNSYFQTYSNQELIVMTHIVVDAYLSSPKESLVNIIQKLYGMTDRQRLYDNSVSNNNLFVELTNKILTKCNHACLPFETSNYGAKSWEEYEYINNQTKLVMDKIKSLNTVNTDKLSKTRSAIQENFNLLNELQKKIEELEKQKMQQLNSEARISHLSQIGQLHPLDRLRKIIQSEHPVFYFPDFMFEDVFEYINDLTPNEKSDLLLKLKTVKKGVLKKLKLTLSGS